MKNWIVFSGGLEDKIFDPLCQGLNTKEKNEVNNHDEKRIWRIFGEGNPGRFQEGRNSWFRKDGMGRFLWSRMVYSSESVDEAEGGLKWPRQQD